MMNKREIFEALVKVRMGDLARDSDGDYENYITRFAWEMFCGGWDAKGLGTDNG